MDIQEYWKEWNKQYEEDGVPFNSFAEHSKAFAKAYLEIFLQQNRLEVEKLPLDWDKYDLEEWNKLNPMSEIQDEIHIQITQLEISFNEYRLGFKKYDGDVTNILKWLKYLILKNQMCLDFLIENHTDLRSKIFTQFKTNRINPKELITEPFKSKKM